MRPTSPTTVTAEDVLDATNEYPRAVTRKDIRHGLISLGLIHKNTDPEITIRRRVDELTDAGLLIRLTQDQARNYRVRTINHGYPSTAYWITPRLAAEIDRRCGRTQLAAVS